LRLSSSLLEPHVTPLSFNRSLIAPRLPWIGFAAKVYYFFWFFFLSLPYGKCPNLVLTFQRRPPLSFFFFPLSSLTSHAPLQFNRRHSHGFLFDRRLTLSSRSSYFHFCMCPNLSPDVLVSVCSMPRPHIALAVASEFFFPGGVIWPLFSRMNPYKFSLLMK